jgi:inner membrane protein
LDPLTHALLGGSVARVALDRPLGRAAWLPGMVGALLPDVDGLIRSAADPLLYVEYHRHFTHSLAFIPLGGLVAALPWLLARRTRGRRAAFLGAATLGYATHGLLDASTTYGTLLLWPFSHTRVAWSWISILDPLFTLLLLVGVAVALWRRSARPAAVALAVCALYLAAGAAQRSRALDVQRSLAERRGHVRERGDAFPTFANNVVWRSIYQAGDTLYLDRIRVGWGGSAAWRAAGAHALVRAPAGPALADERVREDFRRFRWFSAGWLALSPTDPGLIGDARYTLLHDRYEPVWGVRFHPGREVPTEWVDRSRSRRIDVRALAREALGREAGYLPAE